MLGDHESDLVALGAVPAAGDRGGATQGSLRKTGERWGDVVRHGETADACSGRLFGVETGT